ncbi:MAG TPA: hypothetical protein ENO08_05400, partial [Candidatus Eisenbacteria bacterium]|nr:hypothetical protein [Candidatus Eisenbacteria bacterium]
MYDGAVRPCRGGVETPVPPYGKGGQLSLVGRVKLVLPRYRVRGACRIWAGEAGRLVIDFEH